MQTWRLQFSVQQCGSGTAKTFGTGLQTHTHQAKPYYYQIHVLIKKHMNSTH